MSYTLSALRTKLRNKMNQSASVSTVVWGNDELNGYINDAIKHCLNNAPFKYVQGSAFKRTTDAAADHIANNGSGYGSKPDDYMRFVWAEIDGVLLDELLSLEEVKARQDNSLTAASSTIKYMVDASGSEFLIYPVTFETCKLTYIAEPTDLSDDAHTSPLTNSGDTYAVDWAYALALESKLFKSDLAQPIFNRIEKVFAKNAA